MEWLVDRGLAEITHRPICDLPFGWSDEWSRQLSSYAATSGIAAALHIHQRILGSHVLIAGLGGIGCHVVQQLVGMGVASFTLIDNDNIEKSNLNRQVLFSPSVIGRLKVDVVEQYIISRRGEHATVAKLHSNFLDLTSTEIALDGIDLAIISVDSDPVAIRKRAAKIFYGHRIPYGFASYSGFEGSIGPLVFSSSGGCGCCDQLCVDFSGSLTVVDGPGLPHIPASSSTINPIVAALFLERWVRSISSKQRRPETFRIRLDSMKVRRSVCKRLPSCPVCGVNGT